MPLSKGKSDKAREKNIATEIQDGKPLKQAVAIGYSEQRRAKTRENPVEHPVRSSHTKDKMR